MKPHPRVLGIDDSAFSFEEDEVVVVGAVVRIPNYLEGVLKTTVEVDGTDATERLVEMIGGSRYVKNLALILIDGIALGGFNVIDIEVLHSELGIPVATVTRDEPDLESMETALKAKFSDWEKRYDLIVRTELNRVETEHKPVYVQVIGEELENVKNLIAKSTVLGALPEPVRMAHLIATAIKTGESHGRA
ncbi:MAG: DUF99 family protein [Thermoplasmata archaeon]|nr:DUF99 family protein [Thermoplasmata archaeon]